MIQQYTQEDYERYASAYNTQKEDSEGHGYSSYSSELLDFDSLPTRTDELRQYYVEHAQTLEPEVLGALRRYIEAVATNGGITAAARALPVHAGETESDTAQDSSSDSLNTAYETSQQAYHRLE